MQALSNRLSIITQPPLAELQTDALVDTLLNAHLAPPVESPAASGGLIPLEHINASLPLTPRHRQPTTQPRSLWGHFIDIDRISFEPTIAEPIEAGRPDVRVLDASRIQVRRGAWQDWEDVSACFRQCGYEVPDTRRVMVPRGGALAVDLHAALGLRLRVMTTGAYSAEAFHRGHARDDALALMSVVRLGFAEPHAARLLVHTLAKRGSEPPPDSHDSISLAERLDLLQHLYETPQFVGVGTSRQKYPPLFEPGGCLRQRDPHGETPLDIAIRYGNTAMEQLLRARLSEYAHPAAAAPQHTPPRPAAMDLDEGSRAAIDLDLLLPETETDTPQAQSDSQSSPAASMQTAPRRALSAQDTQDSPSLTSGPPTRVREAPRTLKKARNDKRHEPSPATVITPAQVEIQADDTPAAAPTRITRSRRRRAR